MKRLFGVMVLVAGLAVSSPGWWSFGKNNHFQLTWLSRDRLARMNLYIENQLFYGAQEPDRIDGLGKVFQHHRHAHRVDANFNAAVDLLRRNDFNRAAWVIASCFHYLQDALDLSVEFHGDYGDLIRNACYSILANWNIIGWNMNINFQKVYNDTYGGEWGVMMNMGLNDIVRRLQELRRPLAEELNMVRNQLLPTPDGYRIIQDATFPFMKTLATLQAAQDRILDLLREKATGGGGLSDVAVNSAYITISLWDHGTEDGDIVRIFLNGSMLWDQIRLTNRRINLQLQLGYGENLLEIVALNEGTQSPNTASLEISGVVRGKPKQEWSLKTGEVGRMRVYLQNY